jgi:DedD protein
MDQGLKERLIGAAVLVALGVWLIPWVLDGQKEQSEIRSAALQLPSPDEAVPVRTQTLRLDLPQPVSESAVAAAAGAGVTAESLGEPSASLSAATPPPAPAVLSARSSAADSELDPARATATRAVEPEPAATTAHPSDAASKAPADAKVSNAALARPPAGTWLVQLGSFSEEENARRLAQRVATFGYEAGIATHRTNGKTLYRVRVGPHESRVRAEDAASALSAHGFVTQVIAAD